MLSVSIQLSFQLRVCLEYVVSSLTLGDDYVCWYLKLLIPSGTATLKLSVSRLAWQNSGHFATPSLVSLKTEVWEVSAETPYWWLVTTHADLGSASDWLNQISHMEQPIKSTTKTWKVMCHQQSFCACFSDVILWGNQYWCCEMMPVFRLHYPSPSLASPLVFQFFPFFPP